MLSFKAVLARDWASANERESLIAVVGGPPEHIPVVHLVDGVLRLIPGDVDECERLAQVDYQRLRPKPPPPERSGFGRASLTLSALPSSSTPLSAAIAFSASPSLLISTNPKPRG